MDSYRRFLYVAGVVGFLTLILMPVFGMASTNPRDVPPPFGLPPTPYPLMSPFGGSSAEYYQKQLNEIQQPSFQQLQFYINQIQSIINELKRQIQALAVVRGQSYGIHIVENLGLSTIVAGSKAAPLAQIQVDATNAAADATVFSLELTLDAPEDFSQKGLANCQLWDGSAALTAGAYPSPSKDDTVSVAFNFIKHLIVPRGSVKTLTLACDVTKDPQGFATYAWLLGAATAKKALLIPSGSFVLEIAGSSPVTRNVKGGSKNEITTVFDFYAAGEAVQLQTVALQIDGNPRAVTGYSLWDGETQVGGSALSGDSVFKANFTAPFEIPKDGHKLLTVKADIAEVVAGSSVQDGDSVSINFDGNDNNFHLTHGIGASSDHGIIPSTQADTEAPAMTLVD